MHRNMVETSWGGWSDEAAGVMQSSAVCTMMLNECSEEELLPVPLCGFDEDDEEDDDDLDDDVEDDDLADLEDDEEVFDDEEEEDDDL